MSAVIASNILALELVFGALFGLVIYQELLNPREIVGGIIILAAVILTNQLNNRENVKQQPVPIPD